LITTSVSAGMAVGRSSEWWSAWFESREGDRSGSLARVCYKTSTVNAWKVATFVFGISLVVLATRQFQGHRSESRAVRPVKSVPVDVQLDADKGDQRAAEVEDPEDERVTIANLPSDPAEFVLSLVNMYGNETVSVTEKRRKELLRGRADVVAPVLERWLRRVLKDGPQPFIQEQYLCVEYADLLGAGAVPLLAKLAQGEARHAAIQGLCRINEGAAAATLEKMQGDAAKRHWIVDPMTLIQSPAASSRQLALQWARKGPPNDPELAADARWSCFVQGTDSEREEMLRLAEGDERDTLLCCMSPKWGPSWRDRMLMEIPRMIRSGKPSRQLAACHAMISHLALYDEALREEAQTIVARALESETDAEKTKILSSLHWQLGREKQAREEQERWRAELLR
jgi:hypothetical protein